jgi:hypothetical protein
MRKILYKILGRLQHSRGLQQSTEWSLGQVAEWFKAAARKSCYATKVASEVRILPLSAKHSNNDGTYETCGHRHRKPARVK